MVDRSLATSASQFAKIVFQHWEYSVTALVAMVIAAAAAWLWGLKELPTIGVFIYGVGALLFATFLAYHEVRVQRDELAAQKPVKLEMRKAYFIPVARAESSGADSDSDSSPWPPKVALVYLLVSRATLTNPDDRPTTVELAITVKLDGKVDLSVSDAAIESAPAVVTDYANGIGMPVTEPPLSLVNIAGRSAVPGDIVFRIHGLMALAAEEAVLKNNQHALYLVVRDKVTGHQDEVSMPGALRRLVDTLKPTNP